MSLILRVEKLKIVIWWLGASYAMHPDYRNHTGTTISLVWVLVDIMSKRQNLNLRSSTEAEIIWADDVLPALL